MRIFRGVLVVVFLMFVVGCEDDSTELKAKRIAEIAEEIEGAAEDAAPVIEKVKELTGKDISNEQAERILQIIADNRERGEGLAKLTSTKIDDYVWAAICAVAATGGVIFGTRKTKKVARAAARTSTTFNESGKSLALAKADEEGVSKEMAAAFAQLDLEKVKKKNAG